jgi:hypothetical protein
MQQVIRRRVVVESKGQIRAQDSGLKEGTTADVLVIIDAERPRAARNRPNELHKAIAAYAAKHAGTEIDLDPALEEAAVEFLTTQPKGKRR